MSRISDRNLEGIPTKPYDMVREGLIVLAGMTVVVAVLAAVWGFPAIPPVTIKEVATKAPIAFVQRTMTYFTGQSGLQTYGPPYTSNTANAQQVWGICPACWTGVTHPLNARKDMVMQPLGQAAKLDPAVAKALAAYDAATPAQRKAWTGAYSAALGSATVKAGTPVLPSGDYGPVPVLMDGMLHMARAGLLEAALTQNTDPAYAPYNTDYSRALLYMGGPILDKVAHHYDETGSQWGMTHAAGPYPGAWWLWPYAFLYQIPAIASSPNADLIAGMIMMGVLVVLIFLPVIPGLNRLPHAAGVYRIIWRDWYERYPSGDPKRHPGRPRSEKHRPPAPDSAAAHRA